MPKQVIVQSSIEAVEIIDTPIPTPQHDQIVIKVIVSGTNPKDWKYPVWTGNPQNSGDDIAGIIHSVGKDVYEFKPGDRVGALHEFFTPDGSFAEYAVTRDYATFHLPPHVSFEEAATVPLAALTAAIALYADMKLPPPYYPVKSLAEGGERIPLLIYGVTSAVGAFAAKLARLSGLSPIIGISGRAGDYAKTLVDYVVDYRNGEDELVAAVEEVLAKEGLGNKIHYVLDAISENGSLEATLRFLAPEGTVSTVLPTKLFARDKENFKWPSSTKSFNSAIPLVFSTHKDFGYLWSRYIARMLEDGRLKGHPYEVIPGGLNGVLTGLQNLKNGKASAVKYVYRIEDTKNVPNQGVTGKLGTEEQESKDQPAEKAHPLRNFPFSS
ncbi:GroES-like protein [Mollisia scopiformis]|uniref:GroES-like protein n=1 Tax=Mollisia scopiformis TaxID=149040 RepID=A0A132BE47_MOLSC|nr:GroES-like protein [Mollisia scopiformis]KUJ10114.1 GroES-like protein [Mollisia scopiformis]